jgi:gamma-glutamyltranspeptidase/glutathione hydrolase
VLAPAIDYAERGFAVSPNVQDKWTRAAPILKDQPGWAEHFLPQGRVPAIGEHFRLAGAARTLKAIAASNGEAFYRGEIASAIAAHVRAAGGAMTEDDLAACWRFMHSDGWVGTISTDFAGHTLHEIPPNGQGIAALGALGILRHTNLAETIAALGIDAPETQHLMIEAMKLAFADTYAYVSDARSMRVRPADLLDDAYLRERAKRIDPKRASEVTAGAPPRGGTIYLAAADANGMMVSLIQSNYMGFGSGLVVPGYGVSLQNRGHGFAMDAKSPNVVAPGKRPFHTIIPAFLMKDGRPQMSFGVMGGNMQPQGHVQTLVRLLLGGQQPQAACDAPRWKTMDGLELEVEATLPVATVEALRARGHRIISGNDTYMDFGAGQFIWRLGDPTVDGYVAASDPRRDGLAVGF